MKNLDLTKLAAQVRSAHDAHTPIRLPAMRIRDIATLVKLLDQPVVNESMTIH